MRTKTSGKSDTTLQTLTVTGPAVGVIADSEERHRFALTIFCGAEAEAVALSPYRPVVVGRRAPCDVIVDDAAVSRQHARFSVRDDRVFVEDLDSRNGTFVRGKRIDSAFLIPGDSVDIGPARIGIAGARRETVATEDAKLVIVNPVMKRLYEQAERLADRDLPVLITGETGTGKEHLARALHTGGSRQRGPFIAVNCAAIPANLVESTFFGHERGAFTGAASRAIGVFESANGGVVFLDEIGEMPVPMQASLLRALETSSITRVGGNAEIKVDVRVVAATHRVIDPNVSGSTFRPDLYYRLSSVVLAIPPLRERRDEIEPLAKRFLQEARSEWGIGPEEFAPAVLEAFGAYDWPGNVRELRHVVHRAALLGRERLVQMADLPKLEHTSRPVKPPVERVAPPVEPLEDGVMRRERELITEALERTGGNRRAAAALLRVPHRTFYRKLRQHGL